LPQSSPLPSPQQTLQRYFGYDGFRPGQQQVIETVLGGRSAAAIFPTGSGKSLCYQLPALHLPHLTLVVSPLLALIHDQLQFLRAKGIEAAAIESGQTREEAQQVMAGVREGRIKVLMISVERLKNERFRQFISLLPISLLVVDEAHCISEWGHNFRPDYLKLPQYLREFNIPQALLLTATATPAVIQDMRDKFAIDAADVITTGFYRPNLDLLVHPIAEHCKIRALAGWLDKRRGQSSIVYVTLQKTAEQVAGQLGSFGLGAVAYHAGLGSESRRDIQNRFMQGQVDCIVATIAFGMGIDKPDIRNVVHYDLPKSIENYSQEIGRAGRDGRRSQCLVLANSDSLTVLENFVYGDTPERSGIDTVLQQIKASGEQWEVQLNPLATLSGIRLLPLKTLLVYLEMRQVIRPRYAYFADYRFKLRVDAQQLIASFDGERQEFVQALLRHCPLARTWFTVDFDALYRHYGALRERVIRALEYFEQKQLAELEARQMTEVYQVQDPGIDPAALASELHALFVAKERSEIGRIRAMLALLESDQCLSRQLAGYFGDNQLTEPCGHCSVCQGRGAKLPRPPALAPLAEMDAAGVCGPLRQAAREKQIAAPSSELLTRFLCGITSPALTKLKARSLAGFGKLEAYPYAEVKAWLEASSLKPKA